MPTVAPPADPQVMQVVDRYRTCEFATLTRSGVPIAWPTAALYRPDGTFLITTSIALPQKAFNIRRDDRVALLFSEPTASGLDGAPQVLVQG
ncbi:MAG TPA: pyridoxamine 5'-phosphate oxidase family protein, partial [Blastococcus sp.]